MSMKLYNKSQKKFIIDVKDALSGCKIQKGSLPGQKRLATIDGDSEVTVTDVCGERLKKMYPVAFVLIGVEKSPEDEEQKQEEVQEEEIQEEEEQNSESEENEPDGNAQDVREEDERREELEGKTNKELWGMIDQYEEKDIPEGITSKSKKDDLVNALLELEGF